MVPEVWGKPLPMNVSMPIAAVLLDLDFPPAILKGIPILARTASLLAHLAEESANPIGFLMAAEAEEAIAYEPERRLMRDPAAETLPWEAQVGGRRRGLPGAGRLSLRALGLLPRQARRGGLSRRGERRRARRDRGAAADREGRAPRQPDRGASDRRATSRRRWREVVRIYSTSGTTGTPSYIPLTAADLADWIEISSRSYAASGVGAGERIVSTYGAGPFVGRRRRSMPSRRSGSATSRSGPATPSGCWRRSTRWRPTRSR